MRQPYIYLVTLLISANAFGQPLQHFKKDFSKAVHQGFTETELNKMFTDYSILLTPHSDITRLSAGLKGQSITQFPLAEFKNDTLYTNNIDKLLHSKNDNHRILAYLVVASAGDISKEGILLNSIINEKQNGNLIWAGMALLYLRTNHTTELFDFLVKNEDFGDAHMLPLFMTLDKDSLQQTAYKRIDSKNIKAKILAAQILSKTTLNAKTEMVLKQAVTSWAINIKGYAVYSLSELRIGNLLGVLKPLLDSEQTRSIALDALANSPSENDHNYLFGLINKADTVSEDLLNCLYESKNIGNVKAWLKLLYTKPIPDGYIFFVFYQPLIKSDSVLSVIYTALENIKDPKILGELVRALEGRTDATSTGLLINFLDNGNSTVRYWTANTLKGNRSPVVVTKIIEKIKDPATREVSITTLLIDNHIDTLQQLYESIFEDEQSLDWKRSAIEYLSTFPRDQDKPIFRKILKETEDFDLKRNAATGLSLLKDKSSVDLIIAACNNEAKQSDFNAQTYLIALGKLKGEKAKAAVEKFKNSSEEQVRQLVESILSNW